MIRIIPIAFVQLILIAALLGGARTSLGAPAQRVVVLSAPQSEPAADHVVKILRDHLSDLDVDVQKWEVEAVPQNADGWIEAASRAAAEKPGTLALFGYLCESSVCRLIVVEPHERALAEIPVKIPEHGDLTLAFAIAATAREALVGSLLPEMDRLVRQGQNPAPPPPSANMVWMTRAPKVDPGWGTGPRFANPLLWIEGGYNGEYAHPQGHPIHGPWIGSALAPREMIEVALWTGWLGMAKSEIAYGEVTAQRIPVSLSFRLVFSLGPARVTLAPVGRMDVVFVRRNPSRPAESSTESTELEFHAGGMTAWYLPLPLGFDVMIGVGVYWTLYAKDQKIEGNTAMEASALRLSWVMGASWSLL
jgi:hypothetical protein